MGIKFALDLRDDAVCLLERNGSDWDEITSLPVDDPAFPENVKDAITDIRGDDALDAIVFLPESQVLYTEVSAARDEDVATALEGLTPYAVKDLCFDHDLNDGTAKVAAVASVTLEETDQFAAACGISVRAVSARPEDASFARQPVFSGDAATIAAPAEEDAAAEIEAAAEPAESEAIEPEVVEPEAEAAPEVQKEEAPAFASQRQSAEPKRLSERMGRISTLAPADDGPRVTTGRALTAPGVPDSAAAEASLRAVPPAINGPLFELTLPRRTAPRLSAPTRPAGTTDAKLPPQLARALAERSAPVPQKQSKGLTPARKAMIGLTLASSATTAAVVGIFTYVLPPADAMLVPQDIVVTRALTPIEEEQSQTAESHIAALTAPRTEELGVTLPVSLIDPDSGADVVLSTRSIDGIDAIENADEAPEIEIAIPAQALANDAEGLADEVFEEVIYPEWTAAPAQIQSPVQSNVEEVYLAAIDPVTYGSDAVALPKLEFAPGLPQAQSNPSPKGTLFDLDERGYVRATPEGAVTPDGVVVVLGSPPSTPPARPESTLKPAVVQNGLFLTELAEALPADVLPKARPENLVELAERGRFGGRTVNELATIAPRARPAELVREESDAVLIAASLRPNARPSNWAAIVAAAETSDATPAPSSDVAVASLAPATVPSIPSSASVAREATLENALNLGRVSLIGVYGSPSDRRALIRLPSGRFVKVKVGDRVDGGRVAQIQDGTVSYVKSGRNITLEMPRT